MKLLSGVLVREGSFSSWFSLFERSGDAGREDIPVGGGPLGVGLGFGPPLPCAGLGVFGLAGAALGGVTGAILLRALAQSSPA